MKLLSWPRRKSHYILKPQAFEVGCDVCGGGNLDWSEWDHLVWCYDCQIDTKGTEGIFGGPIPVNTCALLGIHFHCWDMEKQVIFDPIVVA